MYGVYFKEEVTIKPCTKCGLELELTSNNYYSNGRTKAGKKRWKAQCKKCYDDTYRERLNNIILEVFNKWECSKCGYNKCSTAIELHHLDEKNKDFAISDMSSFSKDKIINELSKCLNSNGSTLININFDNEENDKNFIIRLENKRNLDRKTINLLRNKEISAIIN